MAQLAGVMLLPFLGEYELYQKYDPTVPWDHPANAEVLQKMPQVYCHPELEDVKSNRTRYFVITGRNTAFPLEADD